MPLVKRTSWQSYASLGVSVGYFLVDMVTCVKYMVSSSFLGEVTLLLAHTHGRTDHVRYSHFDLLRCAQTQWLSPIPVQMGGLEMVLHHIGSLVAVVAAVLTGEGHVFTLWMLFTEFTTPLINNRWWLDKMVCTPGSAWG